VSARILTTKALKISEEALHRSVVEYLPLAFPGVLFLHVPNGGKRSKSEAGRLKAMATLAGAADLLLWWAAVNMMTVFNNGVAYEKPVSSFTVSAAIELKAEGGRQSPEQKAFQESFTALGGKYAICRSIDAVRASLESWGLKSREAK
jgi:hypothetical protein